MRAILCFAALMASMHPTRANECAAFDALMIKRKALTETVAAWKWHPQPAEVTCPVLADLVEKTSRTIVEIERLGPQCATPGYMVPSLKRELSLLVMANDRSCRRSEVDKVLTKP